MKHSGGRACTCIQCNMRRKGMKPGTRRRKNPTVTVFRANVSIPDYRGVPIEYQGGTYLVRMAFATGKIATARLGSERAARAFIDRALAKGAHAQGAVRVKVNPAASRMSALLSRRVVDLSYLHAEAKGVPYKHKFAAGVYCQLLSDGSVRLYRPDGKSLWKNFED